MRLIDADKLWDVMGKATLHHIVTNTLWNTLKSVIENAPTIDAVEVVRCKDCAKSAPLDEHGALWYCKAHDRTTLRHSYCNNGERKGGDDE